jgi:hypothetical protein
MKEIIMRRVKNFGLLTALMCAGGMAWADSPHYIKLDESINTNTFCYVVDLKEAGLGGATSITYSLNATACFVAGCANKNGKLVQGVPKSGTSSAANQTTLPVRNGQTTGTISLCPEAFNLPDPGCTGNQVLKILGATYTDVSLNDGISVEPLQDLSAGIACQ